jgi:hypothetical protein
MANNLLHKNLLNEYIYIFLDKSKIKILINYKEINKVKSRY